jgi:hypothetical protein
LENNGPNEAAEVAEAAEAAPEVAGPAELAEAAAVAAVAAAFRGELAAGFARLERFPIALTDAAQRAYPPAKPGPYSNHFLIEAGARSYRFAAAHVA